MGDLGVDTELEQTGSGTYRVLLSRDWEIWGPNGGYLAVVALRAAGRHSSFARPASFTCHFLGVAEFGTVELTVRTLRRTKRAESLAVSLRQGDQPILEALVWTIGGVDGFAHEVARMPEVPTPDALRPIEELLAEDAEPMFPFWQNIELRPTDWIARWDERPAGETRQFGWYRFRPRATFDDPFLEAGRALLVLDTSLWPAAMRGHPENPPFYAPSIDVNARFHALAPDDEWLLVDAFSPFAGEGLVGGTASVWSESGRLLATGGQQMLCRPTHLRDSG